MAFRFYVAQNHCLPAVADDLSHGQVLALYSGASAESRHPRIAESPPAPIAAISATRADGEINPV